MLRKAATRVILHARRTDTTRVSSISNTKVFEHVTSEQVSMVRLGSREYLIKYWLSWPPGSFIDRETGAKQLHTKPPPKPLFRLDEMFLHRFHSAKEVASRSLCKRMYGRSTSRTKHDHQNDRTAPSTATLDLCSQDHDKHLTIDPFMHEWNSLFGLDNFDIRVRCT